MCYLLPVNHDTPACMNALAILTASSAGQATLYVRLNVRLLCWFLLGDFCEP